MKKKHAENVNEKLIPDPFLVLVNNPKQPLHTKNSFTNHIFWKSHIILSKSFKKVNFIFLPNRMSSVCDLHVIRMLLVCSRMSFICHSYVLVCHPYVTRMLSYDIRMLLVCTHMSSVCHSYILVCHPHPYVTCMYSYVIRMSLVCHSHILGCIHISFVCHSSVVLPWTISNTVGSFIVREERHHLVCRNLQREIPRRTTRNWHHASKIFGHFSLLSQKQQEQKSWNWVTLRMTYLE